MAERSGRVREWLRRYLIAEIAGLTGALLAALTVASWLPDRLAVTAYAGSLGETIGFYAGYLVVRYRREDIAGPPRKRIAVILAAAVLEFGPAEILDTLLIRPAAIFAGSLITGHVLAGILIGKVTADLIFYGLAITSYEVLVRRFLHRFRRSRIDDLASIPPSGEGGLVDFSENVAVEATRLLAGSSFGAAPAAPELIMDLAVVTDRYRRFTDAFPAVTVHFATKCNPDPPLLRHLHALGSGFEVASSAELVTLLELGVDPTRVIFSNPVKPWWHVRDAHAAGVDVFGADSHAELIKLAEHAPGSRILIRMAVPPAASEVPSEGKFGIGADHAVELLLAADHLGLKPWGLTFHVGSQMTEPTAWVRPIREAGAIMERLALAGHRLTALDIGGGFPADYGQPVPPIGAYAAVIAAELARLPYQVSVLAEPGRGLVADAGVLHATVIGLAERAERRWVHLDVGAFNGVMEALETGHRLVPPMSDSRGGPTVSWAVTGPSCDSQDTLHPRVSLATDLRIGDRVELRTAGAYTTAYASTFNGFPVPTVRYLPARTDRSRAPDQDSALVGVTPTS